jgi:hypothetical protein
MAAQSATIVEGILAREGELMRSKENARISKKALILVSAALDAERTKAEATW